MIILAEAIAEGLGAVPFLLLLLQVPFTAVLLSRLCRGAQRQPPIKPRQALAHQAEKITIVVPTRNEANRIEPCLTGMGQQGKEVREIIVVDSCSTDGTADKVAAFAQQDNRLRLITDAPLPQGWVGRPWALHSGFLASSPESEWVLGIDADTEPHPGLAAAVLAEAEAQGYDLLSLSPRFKLRFPGEWWLQPALLMTLIYRFDSAGVDSAVSERVMANGQCFLCRRSVLVQLAGYTCAANSFCDDVTLARVAAAAGFKVGFLDGAQVISVRMYEGAGETWQGWGRSLDLKDAATPQQLWGDLALLVSTQGLPLLAVVGLLPVWVAGDRSSLMLMLALGLNVFLLMVRWGMQFAIAPSYHWPRQRLSSAQFFWLSPLADPLAVLRILLSSWQTSIQWRGQVYRRSPFQPTV
ncbi:MAG: glycosyltransferase [Phormidesmis sp. RL_2_1]|nr:glycosyltransferase [Phormidesmis sp. RL_2_1]